MLHCLPDNNQDGRDDNDDNSDEDDNDDNGDEDDDIHHPANLSKLAAVVSCPVRESRANKRFQSFPSTLILIRTGVSPRAPH